MFKSGYKPTKEHLERLRLSHLGQKAWNKGLKMPPEFGKKVSESRKKLGIKWTEEMRTARSNLYSGEGNPRWVEDRSTIDLGKRSNYTLECIEWRESIFKRDNWRCRISNEDCKGQLEAHHILPWRGFPELRFDINNGITLCHHHHPRRRDEEKRLAPVFKELVSAS